MKKFIIALTFIFLSACATNEFLYNDEYGYPIYKAQCDQSSDMNMGDCLKEIGKQCPAGFYILKENEKVTGVSRGTSKYGDVDNTTKNKSINNKYGSANNSSSKLKVENSYTSYNSGSSENVSLKYSRYIIYTCK